MGDATTPSLSSSASSGANLFASILSSSSAPSKLAPFTNGSSAKKDEEKPAEDAELQYYRSLRGLNESVLASMRKAVDADCSHDLGSFLDKYAEFRAGIQKEFDASKSTSSASSSAAPAAAPKPPAMPAPPAAFAGFGKPAAPAAAPPSVPASAFTFGASAAPASSASAAAKPSPFSFSSSAPTTGKPPSAGPAPPKSLFGSTDGSTSIFGAPKPKDAEAPAPSPFSGAELTLSSGTPFSFAGENPFGKPTGSGFSWGAPAPAAAAPAAAGPAAADADAAEPEAAPSLFPPAQHDLEGEGEEDEETAHSVKAKVYRMSKKTEEGIEKSYWADLGTGVLRLKKHKESPARRMLMRNSNTGKILIVSHSLF
jgi:nucleoporin NUP2